MTNASDPLAPYRVDGRSSQSRKFRTLVRSFLEELGGTPSLLQEQMAQRAAMACLLSEDLEQRMLQDGPIPSGATLEKYINATRVLRQSLSALGLKANKPRRNPSAVARDLQKMVS